MGNKWRNRIVGHGEKPASDFLANPDNWRIHPKPQQDALSGALAEVGWVQQVVENARTGHLIDGHLRVSLALSQGDDTPVPYIQVDLSPEEEALVLATLDPIGAMAAADKEQLDALLRDVQTGEAAIQEMLAELARSSGLDYGRPEPVADPGPQIDRAEELRQKWQTERGQVWEIPSKTVAGKCHRLMCGDSTSAEDVERLMAGERAALVVTSPPYGVGKSYETAGIGPWFELMRPVVANIVRFADAACWNIGNLSATGCQLEEPTWVYSTELFRDNGWGTAWTRIWRKDATWNSSAPFWLVSYKPVSEFEFIGCFAPKSLKYVNRLRDDERKEWGMRGVWDIPSVRANDDHPAKFPPGLPTRCIKLMTDNGDSVLDPFIGSGTTMVAAEQTGRVCYGMEIEPRYAAVVLERMAGMGLEPKLTDG